MVKSTFFGDSGPLNSKTNERKNEMLMDFDHIDGAYVSNRSLFLNFIFSTPYLKYFILVCPFV